MKYGFILILGIILSVLGCTGKSANSPMPAKASEPAGETYLMAGKVEAQSRADIVSTFTARIVKVSKDVGQPVQQGEALIVLDRKEVQTQLESVQQNYANATVNAERAQSLYESKVIPLQQKETAEAQLKQAKAALDLINTQYSNGTLISPLSGVVSAVNVKQGEVSSPNLVMMSIVNPHDTYVAAYLPESLLDRVKAGMQVVLKIAELGDRKFHGRVSLIDPVVDSRSKTVLVRINATDFTAEVKPGMTVTAGLPRQEGK